MRTTLIPVGARCRQPTRRRKWPPPTLRLSIRRPHCWIAIAPLEIGKKRETSTAAETRKGELSLRKTRLLGHRHYFGKGFVPPYINRYVYSFTSSMGTFALLLLASWSVAHARQIPSPDARLSPRPPRLPFRLSLSRVHARLRRFCRPKP